MLEKIRKPIVLALVDGLGIAPDFEKNLFKKINTENFDFFSREYPAMSLYSSGKQIGLSEDEKSNSLLGHLNIGAGRLCYSSKEKINKSILDKTFFENNSFLEAKKYIEKNNSNLHLLGFLGINNEFSDEKQLFSLFEFCKNNKIKNVFLHIFLDIEDTIPETNKKILKKLQNKLQKYNFIKIASLSSKYFAMDEDGHWDRTKKTYEVVCDKENTYGELSVKLRSVLGSINVKL
jgi:2,3-bisphosphoglycerate-independent phosphoglycerate mutase